MEYLKKKNILSRKWHRHTHTAQIWCIHLLIYSPFNIFQSQKKTGCKMIVRADRLVPDRFLALFCNLCAVYFNKKTLLKFPFDIYLVSNGSKWDNNNNKNERTNERSQSLFAWNLSNAFYRKKIPWFSFLVPLVAETKGLNILSIAFEFPK